MQTLQKIALILLIIGGINWGLTGLFDFNLVAAIFGEKSFLEKTIYLLVALSAIVSISTLFFNYTKKVTD